MSDLHQYELHYPWIDGTTGYAINLTRLAWAYSAQEAVFQVELELKARHHLDCRITEATPVKKALSHAPGTHFHVCPQCQDTVACEPGGCPGRERSDSAGPCRKCVGRKPHRHHCQICQADYDCSWIEKNGYCQLYAERGIPCTKHTREEAQAFFQKKLKEEDLALEKKIRDEARSGKPTP